MATQKKSSRNKKKRTSANPRSYSALYKDDRAAVPQEVVADVDAEETVAPIPARGKGSDSVDWKKEYAYVDKDLRQLAIVSAVLFAVIIGIGLFA